jgi:hypothetical protein
VKFWRRLLSILRSLAVLVREHKLYFLAPTFVMLLLIAALYVHLGPALLVSFIYAGL